MFWIVGFNKRTGIMVLDDTDNTVEWISVDVLNDILRNDYSVDIDYKGGSIARQGSYIGITKNGRTCLSTYKRRYIVFDFYERRFVEATKTSMFKEVSFTEGFGINDLDKTHYLYDIWYPMLRRCNNLNISDYQRYGARGVYVDKSFQRLSKFVLWYESQPNFKFRTEAQLEIDKDLLCKKYYGIDSCILLPKQLNVKLGRLNGVNTTVLPRFCSAGRDNCVRTAVGDIRIADKMKDTSYAPSFYENLVIDFMNSRGITEWKYSTSMEDVGRKWITAKKISFSSNKEVCDQSLQKDWITKDYYDRLIDAFDVKITDWGLYEDH